MKKATVTIFLCVFAMIGFAQKDTTAKTVERELVYEKTDTIQVRAILYAGANENVKYFSPGYVLRKGYAVKRLRNGAVMSGPNGKFAESDYQFFWTEQPKTDAILDTKKQRLEMEKVLQIIQ